VLESLRQAGLTAMQEEVCSWTEGCTVSGVPLGWRAGASTGRQDSSDCSLPKAKDQKRGETVFGACQILPAIYSTNEFAKNTFNALCKKMLCANRAIVRVRSFIRLKVLAK